MNERSRTLAAGLGLMTTALFAWGLFGQESRSLPDQKLTPGAVIPGYQMICAPPFAPPRTWDHKRETLAKYGYQASAMDKFEDDDRVPTCAGGDNANPLNHWPERCDRWSSTHRCLSGDAHEKDVLEAKVCRAICDGRLTLDQGQAMFLGDWRASVGAKF